MRPAYAIGTSTHVQGFTYGYNPATDTFTCGGVPVQDDFMLRHRLMPYLRASSPGWMTPRGSSVTYPHKPENTDGH